MSNNSHAKLLIVEDDPNLGEVLNEYLMLKGYTTTLCRDGVSGEKAFRAGIFDLVILDIMMPKKDGLTLARDIRKDQETPIIFLTARNQKEDVIKGLSVGADDYMAKPFSMEELLLRIKAVLRRSSPHATEAFQKINIGKLTLDTTTRILSSGDATWNLTSRESDLLGLLARNMNRTTSRKKALLEIWGDDSYFNARSMDVYINKVRKLLKADENLQIITIHGEGFKLVNIS